MGNQTGEGWFLTGEMMELIHDDVHEYCLYPAIRHACRTTLLAKVLSKKSARQYPKANIAAIDYDPGASEVNQLNRIKLMLSTAQKNLKTEEAKNNN